MLGKEIRIFLYVGVFNYPWIPSVSATSFIQGMVFLLYCVNNPLPASVTEIQRSIIFISTSSASFHALILIQHGSFTSLKV